MILLQYIELIQEVPGESGMWCIRKPSASFRIRFGLNFNCFFQAEAGDRVVVNPFSGKSVVLCCT